MKNFEKFGCFVWKRQVQQTKTGRPNKTKTGVPNNVTLGLKIEKLAMATLQVMAEERFSNVYNMPQNLMQLQNLKHVVSKYQETKSKEKANNNKFLLELIVKENLNP